MKDHKKEVFKKVSNIDYLSPEYLYFKLDDNVKYFIDGKSTVLKEQPLFMVNNHNICSTVSGKVLGIKEINESNYLVIQNNYKEKYLTNKSLRKKINTLSKGEVLDILKKSECNYYSNNINYFINNFNEIDSLILSLMICEDAERISSLEYHKYNSEIMEIFDCLSQIFNIKNPIILLSDIDEENIEYISNLTGMYPNMRITLSHDKYPFSHPLLVKRKLNLSNSLVLSASDIYYLYSILKRNKLVLEKDILITGLRLNKDILINTKLNVLVSDILEACKIKLKKDEILLKNSAIRGEELKLNDVVDINLNSIIIVNKDEVKCSECINCGLCNKNCPQKLNPQRYKLLGKPFPGKCINCNMCSYVCPSKIGRKI